MGHWSTAVKRLLITSSGSAHTQIPSCGWKSNWPLNNTGWKLSECTYTRLLFFILTQGHISPLAPRERGRERNITWEKHWPVASSAHLDQGSNPQPRYVPWLGSKPFGYRTALQLRHTSQCYYRLFFLTHTCTAFDPWLGVRGHKGRTVCTDLCNFIQEPLAAVDFAICVCVCVCTCRGGVVFENQFPVDTEGQLKFWGSQKLHKDSWLCC